MAERFVPKSWFEEESESQSMSSTIAFSAFHKWSPHCMPGEWEQNIRWMVNGDMHCFCLCHVGACIGSIGSIYFFLGNDWNAIAYCISFLECVIYQNPMNKLGYYIDNYCMHVFTNCKVMLDFWPPISCGSHADITDRPVPLKSQMLVAVHISILKICQWLVTTQL